jgi:hypothetical protein
LVLAAVWLVLGGVAHAATPVGKIILTIGKPRLFALQETPTHLEVANADVLDCKPFGDSGRQYAVSGVSAGSTTLTAEFAGADANAPHKTVSYVFIVEGESAPPPKTEVTPPPKLMPPSVPAKPVAAPAPVDPAKTKLDSHIDGFIDPEIAMELVITRPRVMTLKDEPFRVQIGDDKVLSWSMLGKTQRELLLKGEQVGSTSLTLWFGSIEDPKKQSVLSFLVKVVPDPTGHELAREQRTRDCKVLEQSLQSMFSGAQVQLTVLGDGSDLAVVVRGQVGNAADAEKILQVVRACAGKGGANVVSLLRVGDTSPSGRNSAASGVEPANPSVTPDGSSCDCGAAGNDGRNGKILRRPESRLLLGTGGFSEVD